MKSSKQTCLVVFGERCDENQNVVDDTDVLIREKEEGRCSDRPSPERLNLTASSDEEVVKHEH